MKKEKYHLEYIFENVSHQSLWRSLSTSAGLQEWFAEQVEVHGDEYLFSWQGGEVERAILLENDPDKRIRFRWDNIEDKSAQVYYEFNIHTIEVTGERVLEIIDFATDEERIESLELWDMLVTKLRVSLGVNH